MAKPRERWRARSDAAKSALAKGICRGKALRAWVTSRLDGRVEALVLVFRDLQACLHETGRRKGASEAGRPPPHVVENAAARSLQVSTVGPRAHRGTAWPKSGASRQASSHSRPKGRKATSATASVKNARRTDGKSRPTRESNGRVGAGVEGRLQKSVRSIFPPHEGVQSPGAGWVARRGGASRDRRCMPSSGERVRAWERDRKGSASGSHSIARSRIEPTEGVLDRAMSAP